MQILILGPCEIAKLKIFGHCPLEHYLKFVLIINKKMKQIKDKLRLFLEITSNNESVLSHSGNYR